jgi:guanine deaminase
MKPAGTKIARSTGPAQALLAPAGRLVPTTRTDQDWLTEAVDLATSNVAEGGGPFGALIVQDGLVLARGVNRVTRDSDPTAHAEVCAIRAACAGKGDFRLHGATLYTSCEPCPLCLAAALWARVDRVLFAADRHDAARGGFDDLEFYELFARERSEWATEVTSVAVPGAAAPFDAWLADLDRAAY